MAIEMASLLDTFGIHTVRDSNSLAALSAILAFVLFEELALLTNHCFKVVALLEPFFASTMPKHDLPYYLPPFFAG